MAVTVREVLQGSDTGEVELTTGAGTEVGDVLVATQAWNAGNAANMTAPTPGTWVEAALADGGAGVGKIKMWVRAVTSAGAQSVTIPSSGEFAGMHARLRVLAGADSDDPIIAGANAGGFGTSQPAPSVTGDVDALLCCDWQTDEEITYTAPGSMTPSGTQLQGFSTLFGAHELLASAGATGTRTATTSGAGSWLATSVTIAAGAGGTPAEGTATFGVGLALEAAGARDSAGTAELGTGFELAAAGQRQSAGSAATGLGLQLAATGARPSQGTAAFALGLGVAAVGSGGGGPEGLIVGAVTGPRRARRVAGAAVTRPAATGPRVRRGATGPATSRTITGPEV